MTIASKLFKIGDRVGAVSHSDKTTVYLFGYGVYAGDEVPPENSLGWAKELHDIKRDNPKIVLDNGKIVWGCQCWWGPEKEIRESIGNKKVVIVDVEERRDD
jgi:hypothetical protein